MLLPWDDEAYEHRMTGKMYDRYGKRTGFADWEKIDDLDLQSKWGYTYTSPTQIFLVQQVGDIHWLTTRLRENTIHTELEPVFGLPELPEIRPSSQSQADSDYLFDWWKAGWFWFWIRENHEYVAQYDRVLWVDDDHLLSETTRDGVDDIRNELARLGTELHVIRPEPVWTRAEIELWLPETEPAELELPEAA